MIREQKATGWLVMPAIAMYSDAFRDGFSQASKEEYTGWTTELAPTEETICQFIENLTSLLIAEELSVFELHWIAGLFTGWLRRTEFRV